MAENNKRTFMSIEIVLSSMAVIVGVTGCAIPTSVDPLPYYRIDAARTRVETAQLCRLYFKHRFVANQALCEDGTTTRVALSESDLT